MRKKKETLVSYRANEKKKEFYAFRRHSSMNKQDIFLKKKSKIRLCWKYFHFITFFREKTNEKETRADDSSKIEFLLSFNSTHHVYIYVYKHFVRIYIWKKKEGQQRWKEYKQHRRVVRNRWLMEPFSGQFSWSVASSSSITTTLDGRRLRFLVASIPAHYCDVERSKRESTKV